MKSVFKWSRFTTTKFETFYRVCLGRKNQRQSFVVYVKDVLCLLADDAKQSKLDIQLATPRGSVGGLVKDAVVRRVISPQDILDTLSQVTWPS